MYPRHRIGRVKIEAESQSKLASGYPTFQRAFFDHQCWSGSEPHDAQRVINLSPRTSVRLLKVKAVKCSILSTAIYHDPVKH